jgi:hydroxyethylthiazole kinase
VDYVSDGGRVWAVSGGSDLLPRITGSGCWLGTVLASCLAAGGDPRAAVLAGLTAFGLAAERAERRSRGPASFRTHLVDELYLLEGADLAAALDGRIAEAEEILS